MNLEDESSTSSSSSSFYFINNPNTPPPPPPPPRSAPPVLHKRKAGRKKFRETRHPVYRCVRRRNGNKWVCEVREPNKKTRIWLGTFPSPEMAARAHDVAALALRGEMAVLNFPDSASLLPRAKSSSATDIQMAALEAARAFQPAMSPSSSSSSSLSCSHDASLVQKVMRPSSIELPHVESQQQVLEPLSINSPSVKSSEKVLGCSTKPFLDEEALFNMPGLIDSMAEGLLLTPPAMKSGFNWGDMACDMDLTLWRD